MRGWTPLQSTLGGLGPKGPPHTGDKWKMGLSGSGREGALPGLQVWWARAGVRVQRGAKATVPLPALGPGSQAPWLRTASIESSTRFMSLPQPQGLLWKAIPAGAPCGTSTGVMAGSFLSRVFWICHSTSVNGC